MDANSKMVMEESVEKSVDDTIEKDSGGIEEAPKTGAEIKEGETTEPPKKSTNPGNKAEKIKPNVYVEPIARFYKTKDANRQNPFTVSENKIPPTNFKMPRRRHNSDQENKGSSNKKLKTHAKEETVDSVQLKYVKSLVHQKVQEMPKLVLDPGFKEKVRGEIEAMPRSELDDLVIQKMVEEKEANFKFEYMRTQLINSENTLATYRRKIAKMSQQFHDLDKMRAKTRFTGFSDDQNEDVYWSEPLDAGRTYPAVFGQMTRLPNKRKPVEEKKTAKTKEKVAISSTNKIATPKAKPEKASQAENNTLKTTQRKSVSRLFETTNNEDQEKGVTSSGPCRK